MLGFSAFIIEVCSVLLNDAVFNTVMIQIGIVVKFSYLF